MNAKPLLCAVAVLVALTTVAIAQTPTKLGPVFTVAGTGAEYGKIAVGTDGDFMVVWRDHDDIRGRVYDETGSSVGTSFVVQDPSYEADDAFNSWDGIQDVAASGSDGFVVVFNASPAGANPHCLHGPCVFSRRYDDAATAGTQFLVQSTNPPTYQAGNPELAQNDSGDFVVAWEALEDTYYYPTVSSEDVFGRRLGSDGSVFSAKFQANEYFYYYQGDGGSLDVAGGPSSSFVVAWYSEYMGIGFRRVSAAGTPIGSEDFAVPDDDNPKDPQVAYESGGNFLLVWLAYSLDELQGRLYDPAGSPVGDVFTIASGLSPSDPAPAVAGFPNDHFVVVWRDRDEILGQRIDRLGALVGPTFEVAPDGGHDPNPDVDTDLDGNFTIVWENGGALFGQRFAKPDLIEFPLLGKKVKLKDKLPDDPEKRKAQWIVKDPSIALPLPGSAGDPSCNGDPAGTVKASIRFFSTDSGHDTGQIDLPCQWWLSFGTGSKLSYQYKDLKLFDSPCKFIKLKTGQQIRATCLAKNPAFPIDYDLEVGIAEGTVQTVLVMGDRQFCTAIPTFKTKDGSDGKLFLGKDGLAPASCP